MINYVLGSKKIKLSKQEMIYPILNMFHLEDTILLIILYISHIEIWRHI